MGVGLPTNSFNQNSTSFYWRPQNYAPGTDMGGSPLGASMLEQNIPTAYYRYGQQIGVPDNQSAFGRWFAQQLPKFQTGYNAYTISDPLHANITDYANSLGGYSQWLNQFNQLAPQLRGLDAAGRGGGPARWVSR